MSRIHASMLRPDGSKFTNIQAGPCVGVTALPSVIILNDGDAALVAVKLFAAEKDGGSTGENSSGAEAVTENWLEAKVCAGSWTPLGAMPSGPSLSIIPPAVGASVTVSLRLNVPSSPATFGNFEMSIVLDQR